MESDIVDIEAVVAQRRATSIAVVTGAEETLPNGRVRKKWFWLPLSAIEIDPPDAETGQRCVIVIREAFAIEKGLV